MASPADIHNELAPKIVKQILNAAIMQGMSGSDVLVVLETVIAGTAIGVVKLGGDEIVLDKLFENVKLRMAELRLTNIETKGNS